MIELAKISGREVAHALLHEASKLSSTKDIPLVDALLELRPGIDLELATWPIPALNYVGSAEKVCGLAIENWNGGTPGN